jgi:lipopolysaccharide biosynthesis regulator YciM
MSIWPGEILEPIGFKWAVADVQASLGDIFRGRGDLDQAEALYREALATHEALGRKHEMATDFANLGRVHNARGGLDQAEALYHRAQLLFQEMRAVPKITMVQGLLNGVSRQREAFSPSKRP